jgi:1-acyl-sn-glycerol-3-phosphate acyltransferase
VVFYRRVDVTGASRLPTGTPAIIASNHSNGLADPVVLVGRLGILPRFLAANSLWKYPPARLLFKLAGVVPINRKSDGDTGDNREAFEASTAVLAANEQIAIFPEGHVHREPRVVPLKTGAARIALNAAAEGVANVSIVPVGMVYADKGRFRSQAAIHIGKPIGMDQWVDRYRADSVATVRAVTDVLTDRLHEVTLNHASWREAMVVDHAAAIAIDGDGDLIPHEHAFADRSALHRALATVIANRGGEDSDEFRNLERAVNAHLADLAVLGVTNPHAVPRLYPARLRLRLIRLGAVSAVLAPIAAVGVVLDGPVVLLARVAGNRVEHPAWKATAKGFVGFLFFPMIWTYESVRAYRRFGGKGAAIAALAGPIGGIGWIAWRTRWVRFRHTRASLGWFREPTAALASARASREQVVDAVRAIVGEPAIAGNGIRV